ncbi:MAG: polysaccharide biosynthesis tyrosine autokinase [Puniceicoccales bacterium]|jgi:capsular exopolysaccharide synthesis family protein|nr:polysaccharide biosynthesis tyrosine autokinase [Puniceicoccales bacterium]
MAEKESYNAQSDPTSGGYVPGSGGQIGAEQPYGAGNYNGAYGGGVYPHYGYGYGYGYGGYGYGGYGGYGARGYGGTEGGERHENTGGRVLTVRDYLLMVRERFWYLILAVFVCTASSLIYTANKTNEYRAAAKLRIYRRPYTAPAIANAGQPDIDVVSSGDDFQTQIELMKGMAIIDRVVKKLAMIQKLREDVVAPYRDGNIFSGPLREHDVISNCRDIIPQRSSLIVLVTYTHPEPTVAVQMTKLFTDAIREQNEDSRRTVMIPMLEHSASDLKKLADEITALYEKRAKILGENPKLMALDSGTLYFDLNQQKNALANDKKVFQETESLWKQMQDLKKSGIPITKMSVILHDGRVSQMVGTIANLEIELKGLSVTYNEEHPEVVRQTTKLREAEKQRDIAVKAAEERLEEEYKTRKLNYDLSDRRVRESELEVRNLLKKQEDVVRLNRDIAAKEALRAGTESAVYAENLKAGGGLVPNIDLVESPFLASNRPVNKDYIQRAILGIATGSVLGFSIIFGLAFFDDRVKSVIDIEGFLGLPLIGILPVARQSNSVKKARIVESAKERQMVEAFRSIYSALRINEAARTAKVILITSTSPSEGKSFVATNLALTYAMHGERVLLIDGDLRMPVVAKTLQIEEGTGITQYLQGKVSLEDAIHYGISTNFDVLPAGSPCANPTQVIGSRKFAEMISTLRSCYDRILVDTPPIGAVSDVLNFFPMIEGVLYVVRFNTVKKRFIRSNLFRLRESKVPIFGAILNQIGIRIVQYYTNSGDRSYSRYYIHPGKNVENVPIEEEKQPAGAA